jgi:hypothetical protein
MPVRRTVANAIKATRGHGPDRRRCTRHAAQGTPVAIRFTWELDERLGAGRGLLKNLSQNGLCMVAAEAPPRYAKLLIELEGSPSVCRLEAAVVWVKKSRLLFGCPMLVGVRFSGPCPDEFFARALSRAPAAT